MTHLQVVTKCLGEKAVLGIACVSTRSWLPLHITCPAKKDGKVQLSHCADTSDTFSIRCCCVGLPKVSSFLASQSANLVCPVLPKESE